MAFLAAFPRHARLLRLAVYILSLSTQFTLCLGSYEHTGSLCRAIPGDETWPTDDVWLAFNTSIGGRLIRTLPIAAVCHGSDYHEDKCNALRDHWYFPETHIPSASSPMAYEATNNSCNPFSEREAPCDLGGHVAYTVNASSVEDFKATLQFVQTHNLRLVIRNSGHDYLGKSTGAHALALWTHHLQTIELLDDFTSEHYSGPAIKVGSGVDGGQVQAFAYAHGMLVVSGNCPTVGIAGGWAQGGGHGLLSSYLGLGADQVVEWEVLTSDGRLLTATPTSNEDLFWALSGGGGGTYGVVVSMTVKAFPEVLTATALMTVPRSEGTADAFEEVLSTFLQALPTVVDAGVTVIWVMLPFAFLLLPAAAPGLTKAELDELLKPTTGKLDQLQLGYEYNSAEHPDFLTAFQSIPQSWNVSDFHPSGRLVPRSLVEDSLPELVKAVLHAGDRGLLAGVSYNNQKHAAAWPVSVSPHLRNALFNMVVGAPVNYSAPEGWAAAHEFLQNDLTAPIRRLAPSSGSYLSETNPAEPDWQEQFYGGNYDRLLAVKDKYDPDDVFYAPTAVGSHRWVESVDGRLCRVEESGSAWEHSEL